MEEWLGLLLGVPWGHFRGNLGVLLGAPWVCCRGTLGVTLGVLRDDLKVSEVRLGSR